MSMVRIKRGKSIAKVSKSTYENIYKPLGYKKIEAEKETRKKYEMPVFEEDKNIDVDTIPVSDMNAEQLKEYAMKHNIDLKGTKSVSEARRAIQKHLREQK